MNPNTFTANLLRYSARGYASAALVRLERRAPGCLAGVPSEQVNPAEDFHARVEHLAESVAVEAPELFVDVTHACRVTLAHRQVPDAYLEESIQALREALAAELSAESYEVVEDYLVSALTVAQAPPVIPESPIEQEGPRIGLARRFLLATLEGTPEVALDLVRQQLDQKLPVAELQDHVLIPALSEIGRMWQLGESPIADEHLTSLTVRRALELMQAHVPTPPADGPKVLAFAVGGNPHDLPVRIVSQRMELAGFQVTDLGSNMPASDLAWAVTDRPFDLLAVSATLLQHLGDAREVVARRNAELDGKPPILFGGGVFGLVPDLHTRLGGEGSAATARDAAAEASKLLG